jgi:hypothetical protein
MPDFVRRSWNTVAKMKWFRSFLINFKYMNQYNNLINDFKL